MTILTEIAAQLPDNNAEQITPAILRGVLNDMVADYAAVAAATAAADVSGLAPLASPALTGAPTAPTPTVGDSSTKLSTTAFVATAVANLVNGSPAALDTLKELADALGDDANFATTVTNALALKAPLASPALTGTPTAPTATTGDSSTKIATTAFASNAANITSGTLPVGREPPGVVVFDTATVELWLGTGQSNMARQPAYSWSPPANAKIWNLTIATDGSVGTAFASLPNTTISFPNAFIADRANRFPNKTIYLLNVSKESNPIAQWLPGASSTPPLMDVYANIIANITAALAAAGVTTITGVLWWQGETDCANASTTWRTDFETVVTRFQTNSWCPATIPWVICGIGGRDNNSNLASGGLAGDMFNEQYILPAVNASPQYRRYLDVAAWPYISATGVQYWESATPDHFLGQGYFEAGGIASKSFYHDVGSLVLRSQRPINWANVGTIDSPVTWNWNKAATVAPLNGGGVRTYIHAVAADGDIPVADFDSFGVQGWVWLPRVAGGTLAAKTAVASNAPLFYLAPQTWDGSAYNTTCRIAFRSVNAQSGTDHSSKIVVGTTPIGSTTLTDAFYFEPDGSFSVGQDVSAGVGVINAKNGFKINNVSIAGNLPATATNDSASAGNVGEYVESVVLIGSAVSLVNTTPKTVTSITLGAGDWDVDCVSQYFPANTTQFTALQTSLSLATNTMDTTPGRIFTVPQGTITSTGAFAYSCGLPNYRFSLSGTTTIFMVADAAFTVSTMTAYGILRARRVR